MLYLEKEE